MDLGKYLIVSGAILIGIGAWLHYGPQVPLPLGRLPGDIRIERNSFRFYFPLTTCLLLSLILTVIYRLFRR